jgi:hypothetical protein
MGKTFIFVLKGDPTMILDQIRTAAARKRIVFHGDPQGGWFSGGLPGLGLGMKGTFRMTGGKISITVDEKPAVYTWEQVKSMLRDFVESWEGG